jgi:hypothetical protein
LPEYASAAGRFLRSTSAGYGNFQGRNALGRLPQTLPVAISSDAGTASTVIHPVRPIPIFRMEAWFLLQRRL